MKCKSSWRHFQPFHLYMDRIVFLEYVASADDVQIKYFHRRQPQTTTGFPAKLYSAQLRREAGGQYLGHIMDLAINVHICRRYVGGIIEPVLARSVNSFYSWINILLYFCLCVPFLRGASVILHDAISQQPITTLKITAAILDMQITLSCSLNGPFKF